MEEKTQENEIEGIISVTGRGIGYITAEGYEQDIEIQKESLNTALNRDTVSVSVISRKINNRTQGEVTKIVSRARTEFVGVIEKKDGDSYLAPDDRRMYTNILIPSGAETVKEDNKVLVTIVKWDDASKEPEGKIVKVLGRKGDHETEMQAIILGHSFDTDFPHEVEEAAKVIGENREITPD
ncbi:hypothetical protein ACFL6I_20045 [candidate division KSB1 bacterium]